MLSFIVVVVLILGVNTTIWGLAGLWRVVFHKVHRSPPVVVGRRLKPSDVAVLIAAHNEELVIANTIRSAFALVPAANVFVASDASTDATAVVARQLGANVVELMPNRGKAGALVAAIEYFHLARDFEVVMLLDADTQLASDYMETGLPFFDETQVVAVAGRAATIVEPPSPTRMGRFLVAYRERFYVVVQFLLKYGQAARGANVVSIVPGFASMYRSRILEYIDISAPGLAIEDFNMTFEVHAKKLGRIAFHPKAAIAYTQDPDTLRDYTNQLSRWALGFWQTLRRHGFRFGRFWGSLVLYVAELISSSVMLILLMPILLVSIGSSVWVTVTSDHLGPVAWFAGAIPPQAVLVGVLLPDYLLTILVVIVTRRPAYLILGLAFPLIRILDAGICLRALPRAFLGHSSGTWKSPERRSNASAVTDLNDSQTASA